MYSDFLVARKSSYLKQFLIVKVAHDFDEILKCPKYISPGQISVLYLMTFVFLGYVDM